MGDAGGLSASAPRRVLGTCGPAAADPRPTRGSAAVGAVLPCVGEVVTGGIPIVGGGVRWKGGEGEWPSAAPFQGLGCAGRSPAQGGALGSGSVMPLA